MQNETNTHCSKTMKSEISFSIPMMPVPWRIGATKTGIIYLDKMTKRFERAVSVCASRFRVESIAYPKPVSLEIRVYMHYRTETYRTRDIAGRWSQHVPDCTNVQKAVEDALAGILYDDDIQVCSVKTERFWQPQYREEKIEVVVREININEYKEF